jgi:hypothetical protein
VHDFGQAGGFFYLLMEFVDGANLRTLLQTHKFTPEQALAIIPPLCDVLQYAHDRGIVHRDIKPENLLMDKEGGVKVADFGLAKMLDADPDEKPVGTPSYMAPEQVADPSHVDNRADIYSLGVVFYEMLTGELPAKQIEAPSRKVQIDVRLDEVVLRALEKNPEMRFQKASILKTQVETISGDPGSTRVSSAVSEVYGSNQSSAEKVEIDPPATKQATAGESRAIHKMPAHFSRTAIVGACCLGLVPCLGLLAVYARTLLARNLRALASLRNFQEQFASAQQHGHVPKPPPSVPDPPIWAGMFNSALPVIGLIAIVLATTILGWIAVSRIRRSAGKLCGLWLAVFDGLLFPLLVLDAVIFGLVWLVIKFLIIGQPGDLLTIGTELGMFIALWLCLATLISALADFLIIRRVWHAVNQPTEEPIPQSHQEMPGTTQDISRKPFENVFGPRKPSHFWRWFAVAVLVAIALFLLIVGSVFVLEKRFTETTPKPIPPEAAQMMAAMQAYAQNFSKTHDMKDTNVLSELNQELAGRSRAVRQLLRGTVAEPSIEKYDAALAALQSAKAAHDDAAINALSEQVKTSAVEVEKLISAASPSPMPAPAAVQNSSSPTIETDLKFLEVPSGLQLDLNKFDIQALMKHPDVKLLSAPRVTVSSGRECEIEVMSGATKDPLAPTPTGVTARLRPTLNGETVHYAAKLSVRTREFTGEEAARTAIQEFTQSGDAPLDKHVLFDVGSTKDGRRLLGWMVFHEGNNSPPHTATP